MKYKEVFFIPIILMMVGCASGAKVTMDKAANDNVALLYVYRPSCPPILLEPTVYINDIEVADLYNNGYFHLELRPGKYSIKMVWSFISGVRPQSTIIDIMAQPGTAYYVRVYTHIQMVSSGLSPIYISEYDTYTSDENVSLPLIRNCKLIGRRPGVDSMIIPK